MKTYLHSTIAIAILFLAYLILFFDHKHFGFLSLDVFPCAALLGYLWVFRAISKYQFDEARA